jgi:hypothetical protein
VVVVGLSSSGAAGSAVLAAAAAAAAVVAAMTAAGVGGNLGAAAVAAAAAAAAAVDEGGTCQEQEQAGVVPAALLAGLPPHTRFQPMAASDQLHTFSGARCGCGQVVALASTSDTLSILGSCCCVPRPRCCTGKGRAQGSWTPEGGASVALKRLGLRVAAMVPATVGCDVARFSAAVALADPAVATPALAPP